MTLVRRTLLAALRRAGLVEPLLALRHRSTEMFLPLRRAVAARSHGQQLKRYTDLLLVHYDGAWEVARCDERLVVRDVMIDNLDMVTTALEHRGIPHFLVPIGSPNRYRIATPVAWRPAVLDALIEISDPAVSLYIDDRRLTRKRRRIAVRGRVSRRVRARALRRPVWRVYVNRADAMARTVLGHLHGCEVEFWSEPDLADSDAAPPLRAERWNKKAVELPADVTATGSVEVRDRSYSTIREFNVAPHFDDTTFPIDVVYTWVDGSDPVWLERKNAVLRELNLATVHPDAYDASRYRSRDELKYSLRSVAMFADFVRHIYIVTDDQTPPWLNTDNPRVTVVHHKEIFDETARLPTFNSHAIEARLHHIDDLAEHYLYLNDDFLFCRRVSPEMFFMSNGLSRFFLSSALIRLPDDAAIDRSVDVAARNSQELIRRHFGRITNQKMKHAPYPQRRSVLLEAEEVFREEFARTASSQIRSPSDIPVASAFSHYYAYLTGRAVPGAITARYIDLSGDDFERRLRILERKRHADTVCINDAELDSAADVERREQRLQAFLDTIWPVKSEFER